LKRAVFQDQAMVPGQSRRIGLHREGLLAFAGRVCRGLLPMGSWNGRQSGQHKGNAGQYRQPPQIDYLVHRTQFRRISVA